VAFVGDSKTTGTGAGAGSQFSDGAFAKSRCARFSALLTAAGYNVRQGFAGYNGLASPALKVLYDPRLTIPSGWGGGTTSFGGTSFTGPAGTAAITFAPGVASDRFSVFHLGGADRGPITVAKGAETKTITPSGANSTFARTDVSFDTKDSGLISISSPTGSTTLQLLGGVAWDSASPYVEVMNCGIYGCTSSVQASATSNIAPLNALAAYKPHLTIINLGTNDQLTGVALADYIANMTAIATVGLATGTVILTFPTIGGAADRTGGAPDANRKLARDAFRQLAVTLGCLFVDEDAQSGGRAAATAAGFFRDNLHEVDWAYDMQAGVIARAII
jgi:hypothetical protein